MSTFLNWLLVGGICAVCFAINWTIDSRKLYTFGLWWWGGWVVFDTAVAAWNLTQGQYGWAGLLAFAAAIAAWSWWNIWNKRRRQKGPSLVGAKSRALVEKLIIRQREATVPSQR